MEVEYPHFPMFLWVIKATQELVQIKAGNAMQAGRFWLNTEVQGATLKILSCLLVERDLAKKGDSAPPGSSVGENGILGRPKNSESGASIDIPSNGEKPHETLHYPGDSP